MKSIVVIIGTLLSLSAWSVHVNPKGTGEVLLIPYYTVNNGLNTLVTVTNTTAQTKALKVTFRESQNGHAVLSYNVYLSEFDVWAFALAPTPSTLPGHANETSVMHLTADTSCAPLLNKPGAEFTDAGLVDGPQELTRIREGYIEIIEMGGLVGAPEAWADHGRVGVPASCQQFASAWQPGGIWHEPSGGDRHEHMVVGIGGLMADAQLIDVAQGISYAFPAVTLADFWGEGQFAHAAPDDSGLSLDAAAPYARIFDQTTVHHLAMDSGIDAVSAAITAQLTYSHYALDQVVNGQTELVFSFPTRRFYFAADSGLIFAPFDELNDSDDCAFSYYGGNVFGQVSYDREGIEDPFNGGPPRPPPPNAMCGAVFVLSMQTPENYVPGSILRPIITGSNHFLPIKTPNAAVVSSGYLLTYFAYEQLIGYHTTTGQAFQIEGLPLMALTLNRSTNAHSQPGLLAQYGGAVVPNHIIKVTEAE